MLALLTQHMAIRTLLGIVAVTLSTACPLTHLSSLPIEDVTPPISTIGLDSTQSTYIASNVMDYGTYTKTARTQDGTASHKPVTRRTTHPSLHESSLDEDTVVVRSVGHSKESHRITEKDAFHPTPNRRIQPRDASSHEINKPDQLIGLVHADDARINNRVVPKVLAPDNASDIRSNRQEIYPTENIPGPTDSRHIKEVQTGDLTQRRNDSLRPLDSDIEIVHDTPRHSVALARDASRVTSPGVAHAPSHIIKTPDSVDAKNPKPSSELPCSKTGTRDARTPP